MKSISKTETVRPIAWRDDALYVLDQRLLPAVVEYVRLSDSKAVANAIRDMLVRGAPAIGLSAAYGAVLALREAYRTDSSDWKSDFEARLQVLANARPTAVNLAWAIEQCGRLVRKSDGNPQAALLDLAHRLFEEDLAANQHMGDLGAALIDDDSSVMTHCNAGALATAGYGTALGVIRSAWQQNKLKQVYAGETRPWNQGARLTIWELSREQIPVSLLADSAAASLMRQQQLQWVIVGADRITANGDVVNKIGTYSLAILARHHGVRFMVAAPTSTIDWDMQNGEQVPIEMRESSELLPNSYQNEPDCPGTWNPVFDMTPAHLVDAIVTEKGVVMNPDPSKMAEFRSRIDS